MPPATRTRQHLDKPGPFIAPLMFGSYLVVPQLLSMSLEVEALQAAGQDEDTCATPRPRRASILLGTCRCSSSPWPRAPKSPGPNESAKPPSPSTRQTKLISCRDLDTDM